MRLEDLSRAVRRLVGPLETRARNMIARGVVRLVTDTPAMQELQVEILKGEVRDRLEHFQPFGFTSTPVPGSEAVVLSVGGDRSHGLVLCVADRRYRLAGVAAGGVAIHNLDGTSRVVLEAGGAVELEAAGNLTIRSGGQVTIDASAGIDLLPGAGLLNLGASG